MDDFELVSDSIGRSQTARQVGTWSPLPTLSMVEIGSEGFRYQDVRLSLRWLLNATEDGIMTIDKRVLMPNGV